LIKTFVVQAVHSEKTPNSAINDYNDIKDFIYNEAVARQICKLGSPSFLANMTNLLESGFVFESTLGSNRNLVLNLLTCQMFIFPNVKTLIDKHEGYLSDSLDLAFQDMVLNIHNDMGYYHQVVRYLGVHENLLQVKGSYRHPQFFKKLVVIWDTAYKQSHAQGYLISDVQNTKSTSRQGWRISMDNQYNLMTSAIGRLVSQEHNTISPPSKIIKVDNEHFLKISNLWDDVNQTKTNHTSNTQLKLDGDDDDDDNSDDISQLVSPSLKYREWLQELRHKEPTKEVCPKRLRSAKSRLRTKKRKFEKCGQISLKTVNCAYRDVCPTFIFINALWGFLVLNMIKIFVQKTISSC